MGLADFWEQARVAAWLRSGDGTLVISPRFQKLCEEYGADTRKLIEIISASAECHDRIDWNEVQADADAFGVFSERKIEAAKEEAVMWLVQSTTGQGWVTENDYTQMLRKAQVWRTREEARAAKVAGKEKVVRARLVV